ncbi:transcription termination/antitermination protein NusA [Candidatus Avelusimicrobium luingense]|uniref:transcription termination/antitermination protein NusA n=1 Tax=Candidatus Avelusimicrobium luingense TaxID=3416211 RepID=UPI003D13CC59
MEGTAKDLILALEGLEREKNIKREDILKTIEDALVSALRKNLGKTAQISAKIDVETGSIKAYQLLNVTEIVTNAETEISVENAKQYLKNPKVGDTVTITLEVKDFSRIAAQIAKQVLIQKVRSIERDNFYNEYKPREGEVITGSVRRFSDRDIIVDLGKVEALLPYCEQIHKERYAIGSRIKAVIAKVLSANDLANIGDDPVLGRYKSAAFRLDKGQRGPYVILSRANNRFLEELFKVEVPEIEEGIVEIKKIERDPGFRAKVIVSSIDSKIDPIGTCVGMRGIRIRAVMNELSGERIDLINHSNDISTVLMNSIAPAKANLIKIINATEKKALIIVPDDQLAIAIGKDWQNIKLASRLTGWDLTVKSETQKAQSEQVTVENIQRLFAQVEGIGEKMAEVLQKAGFTTVEQLAQATPEHLATVQGIGEKTAENIITGAKKYLVDLENQANATVTQQALESEKGTKKVSAKGQEQEPQHEQKDN